MIWILSISIASYFILIAALTLGIRKLTPFEPANVEAAEHGFSVIVVFRNEEAQLANLISQFEGLDYPKDKFEVLLVDDASEDSSLELAKSLKKDKPNLNLNVMEFQASSIAPKKEAIETAVGQARYPWIITTDADCRFDSGYLKAYDQFISAHEPKLIAGPVICTSEKDSFLHRFQSLDFLSLQGSTMGGFGGRGVLPGIRPFMCNGANLCYEKQAFIELGGYEGSRERATGDDVFLLEKMMNNYQSQVHFIKSSQALVRTGPKDSWKELVSQRKRWASKSSAYDSVFAKFTGLIVLMANLALIAALGMGFYGSLSWSTAGLLFIVKMNVDFVLIFNTASLWNQQEAMRSFVASSFLYPFFVTWVALQSLRPGYQWKGRRFDK